MEPQKTTDKVPVIRLDFEGLSEEEHFSAWQENLSLIFEVDRNSFEGTVRAPTRLTTYHFGSLLFSNVASHGQTFKRSSRLVSRTGVDHFLVQVYQRGRTAGSFGRNHLCARPGDVLVLDLEQTLDTRVDDFENLTLVIPRRMLEQHLRCPEKLHGRILPRESVPGRLLTEHLDMLWRSCAEAAPEEAGALGHGVAGLMAAYFAQIPVPEDAPEIEAATGLAIRQYIARHFANPLLSPEFLAKRFRISRAQLYRLFRPYGGVAEYIRERRLIWSLSELSKQDDRPRRVIDVALAAGFGSEAHFSRLFRRVFGISPTEARQGAAREAMHASCAHGSIERRLQEWLRQLG